MKLTNDELKMLSGDGEMIGYYNHGFRYLVDNEGEREVFKRKEDIKSKKGIKWNIRKDGSLDAYEMLNTAKSKTKNKYEEGYRYLVENGDDIIYGKDRTDLLMRKGRLYEISEDGMQYPIYDKCDDPTDPDYYECEGGELINLIKGIIGEKGWTGYCQGNIIKYIVRAPGKNGVEDLEKAKVYIDFLINGGLKNENRQ